MTLLLLPVGLLLPTLCGWFVIALLERNQPVLYRLERWTLSVVFGLTMTMYLSFIAHLLGFIPFTLIGLLGIQVFSTLTLGMMWMRCKVRWSSPSPLPTLPSSTTLSRGARIVLILLCVWTAVKLLGGFVALTATPPYEDDVFNNWNMRGKLFFLTQELTLEYETGNEMLSAGGVNSYPVTVPLTKTWLATLAGKWNEGLVNSIHFVWFLSVLSLVYCALRRKVSRAWALTGAYGLSSLPLYFMHGTTAYADVFLSVHIFAVVSLLYGALQSTDKEHRLSFLRLSALAAGVLVFTKNEALIMHMPVLALIALLILRYFRKSAALETREIRSALLHYLILIGIVLIPWVLFKWSNNLSFGNAKSVLALTIAWQQGVAYAITVNTFFEGNWVLLFPFLICMLFVRRREAFFSPAVVFSAFFLLILLGQLPLYFFTGLSTEAVNQTGYARGLVQLAPVAVTLLILLTHSWYSQVKNS